MRKTLPTVLSFALIIGVVLSACSEQNEQDSETKNSASIVSPAGTLPIVQTKTDVKVMIVAPVANVVENYETNEFTKWLEEKTNVHIVWDVVPKNGAQDKLNVALASGDYPDVILGFDVNNTMQMIYGSQGVFLPLNDMIEKYGVETKKVFTENPNLKDSITAPDGKIYALPDITGSYHATMPQKLWIYKPWLDKLGLSLPTTTDEFYQVLKAFKEKDPNGNGKADEIPIAGFVQADKTVNIGSNLMNSFIYNNNAPIFGKRLYVNNGKIEAAFNKPEWKEGLAYIRKLYADGLIYAPSFTQDQAQLKQIGENAETPILGASEGISTATFTQLNGKSGRWKEYVAVPPLKGPKGFQSAATDPYTEKPGTFIITKAAKNPDVAFRLADFLYTEEASMREFYGVPDVDWRKAKPGELGLDGKQGSWIRNAKKGDTQNSMWGQGGLSNRSMALKLGEVTEQGNEIEGILYRETKQKYEPYKQDVKTTIPPLFFTNEQAGMLADLEKTIRDYVNEMYVRFIIGDAKLDTEWDRYLQTLDKMNLNKFLQIYQEAYDAKYKK